MTKMSLPAKVLDFLREKKLTTLLNDISLTAWIYRQISEVGIFYIEDMKKELIKTIFVVNDKDIKKKYLQELDYLSFLIERYK